MSYFTAGEVGLILASVILPAVLGFLWQDPSGRLAGNRRGSGLQPREALVTRLSAALADTGRGGR